MKILEVTNLCKTYGKGDTMVKALDNVSFSVEKGEFLAIIGPSGSGKSTLLHILGGVDVPTSGSVVINQTDISNLDETALAIFRRRQIGLIYQFYNLIPILTVQENLTLPLLLDGRKPDKKQIYTLVKRLGGKKIWLTHGHNYYVSLDLKVIEQEAVARGMDIVMFGHTHRPVIIVEDNITLINPGSISYPRQADGIPTYIIFLKHILQTPYFTGFPIHFLIQN